jgi:hypothetical protein
LAADRRRLAVGALAFIASHDDLTRRFLDLAGLSADQLRAEAERPKFLVAVFDFIMENEPDVIDFASVAATNPRQIGKLRNAFAVSVGIPGGDHPS